MEAPESWFLKTCVLGSTWKTGRARLRRSSAILTRRQALKTETSLADSPVLEADSRRPSFLGVASRTEAGKTRHWLLHRQDSCGTGGGITKNILCHTAPLLEHNLWTLFSAVLAMRHPLLVWSGMFPIYTKNKFLLLRTPYDAPCDHVRPVIVLSSKS